VLRGRGGAPGWPVRGHRQVACALMGRRPVISWSDLRGSRVGIWGLGVEGEANLRKLTELGADLVLVDDRPAGLGPGGHPVLATREGGLDALATCAAVVKTPGISRYRPQVARLQHCG